MPSSSCGKAQLRATPISMSRCVGVGRVLAQESSGIILSRAGWRGATSHSHSHKEMRVWGHHGVQGQCRGIWCGEWGHVARLGLDSWQSLLKPYWLPCIPHPQIFRCLPSNATRSLRALREYVVVEPLATVSPPLARSELTQVQGHLVHFPLKFLEDEYLLPSLGSKEGVMPLEVWT